MNHTKFVFIFITILYVFCENVNSLEVLKLEFLSDGQVYVNKDTGYCQLKLTFKVDPYGCSSSVNIYPRNSALQSTDYFGVDNLYQYFTNTYLYPTGQYPMLFDLNCTGFANEYTNMTQIFSCYDVPTIGVVKLSPFVETFAKTFTTYQAVAFLPQLKFYLPALNCNAICYKCSITSTYSLTTGSYFTVSIIPLPGNNNCYNILSLSILIGDDVIYSIDIENNFFTNSLPTVINKNTTYPSVNKPPFAAYISNIPIWNSVDLVNPSPFHITRILTKDIPLYPVQGNSSFATYLSPYLPSSPGTINIMSKVLNKETTLPSIQYNFSLVDTNTLYPLSECNYGYIFGFTVYGTEKRQTTNQLNTYISWYVPDGSSAPKLFSKFKYPYGYRNGTIDNASFVVSVLTGNITNYATALYYTNYQIFPTTPQGSPLQFRLSGLSITPFGTYSFYIQIGVNEPQYGIYKIQIGSCTLNEKDLASGDIFKGYYEKVCRYDFIDGIAQDLVIEIYGRSMEMSSIQPNTVVPFLGSYLNKTTVQFNVGLNDIGYVGFSKNNVDVTNLSVWNYFLFNLTTNNRLDYKPILEIFNQDFNGNKKQFTGQWNSTLELYVIPFLIPMNSFEGLVPYRLLSRLPISNAEFYSKFRESSQLYLQSKNADLLGPMVTGLTYYSQNSTIGWEITIEDKINGFKEGYICISSFYQPSCMVSKIPFNSPTILMSGDMISIPYVVADNFTISIYAVDNGGNIATSIIDREISMFQGLKKQFIYTDPFMKIYNTDIGKNMTIITNPEGTIDDSGFNYFHLPTVYVISLYQDIIEFPVDLIEGNSTYCKMYSNISLPYGFGSSEFFIAVYGLSDIYYNLYGYAGVEASGFFRNFTKTPYLESYEPISREGGMLTVYGYQFGSNSSLLSFTLTNDTMTYTISATYKPIVTNSYLIISIPSFGNSSFYNLTMYKNPYISNLLTIYPLESYYEPIVIPTIKPTQTPTTTPPKPCPGNPTCNGNGNCVNSECKCFKNFFGPDCSSQLIPSPPPNVNPSTPGTNTTVITPNDNTLISELSIDSLRELNDIGNVVAEYKLSNYSWNFENLTKVNDPDFIEYRYSTLIKNTTQFNITIQWFLNEFNYSFAGDNYTMSKSSLKYSISISTYEFLTNLNQLQVIMSATLIGANDDCSSKSFGTTSTSDGKDQQLQWIKLKVGYESLYGRFIEKAVVDDDAMIVINRVLDDQYQPISTTSTTQSFIGIDIPHFSRSVLIDPDFSILVDNTPASDDPNSKCNSKSSGLILSYEFISENPTYFNALTSSCQTKIAFKIDPARCTSPINVVINNGNYISQDSIVVDNQYQYHYYTFAYNVGQSIMDFMFNCTGGGQYYLQNSDNKIKCLNVPNFSITSISAWQQTFNLGFQSYESVFDVPELNYTLLSLVCDARAFECTATPRYSKSKGYFSFILTIVPFPGQLDYNSDTLTISVGPDVKFTQPLDNIFFSPTDDQIYNDGAATPNGMYINNGDSKFALYFIKRLIPNQMSTYVDWYETGQLLPHTLYSKYNFPFGYMNGTAQLSFSKSVHLIGNLTNYGTGAFYVDYHPIPYGFVANPTMLKVDNITLTPFGTYSFFIQIGLSEPLNGVYKIQIGSCNLFDKDLVFGNAFNGIYEKVCRYDLVDGVAQDLVIEIYSKSMALLSFTPNSYIPTLGSFLPPYQFQFNIPLNEFSMVGFANEVVNVTNLSVVNYFYFNLTSTNNRLDYKPILEIFNEDFNGNKKQFTGQWNSTLQLYVIPFLIPMNSFEGLVPYRLLTQPPIRNSQFCAKFGESSQLTLQSENADLLGPIVTSIKTFYQANVIGWEITIEDDVNGFSNGYLNVTSNYHSGPIAPGPIYFRVTDRVGGDQYVGIYILRISIPHNVAENYTLSLYAVDNGGNIATSFADREIQGFKKPNQIDFVYTDPFMKIYGTEMEKNLTIITNPRTEKEGVAPKLDRFSVTRPIVDVGVSNISTTILYQISDNTNIDTDHAPTIYVSSMYEATVEFQSALLSSNSTHASFSCQIILPYGFGSTDFYISIYGISDIYYNLIGYTPLELSASSFSFGLKRQFSKTYPYLESYEPISKDGGQLTIYGYQFGTDLNQISFKLSPPNGEVMINLTRSSVSLLGNSYIIINFPSFGNFYSLELVLMKSTFSSNVLTIYPTSPLELPNVTPTPTPTSTTTQPPVTPTPKQCPGNPTCTGNGNCVNSECKCFKNFFGPDCSSQLIPSPPPNVNPSTPGTNTTVITPNDNTLISELSIDSLRELNDIGNVVAEYKLSNYSWNFENLTKVNDPDFIEYRYSTLIKNTTQFNITIQWFLNEFNYSFAGDNYTMSKSSLKYSISISTYEFLTNLNQLQVIMSATLIGANDDCSSKSFGTTSTSDGKDQQLQWIKLKVGYESLYGRFIEKAVVDDDAMIVINRVLDDQYQPISTTSTTQSFIGIDIPHFSRSVLIDPDFSILVDNTPASDDPNSKCNSKSSGLSKYQIIGIAVGAAVIAIAIAGTITYITLKNKRQAKSIEELNMKMQKLKSDKT
ncbi:EGF-like domain-containing protein [Heterostelium album PN500]|uniref:EGF-like domain-containing protein n=1 Tax=Heterostelium pallidum (strain ATCC 26659 / Pp 5 / PN500) TaxID=670386 RepID=D3BJ00_HETP5|nr:EGF-like domain-containing protein [Heterostelium album PN500]EFA78774.1 EGF-like domain-containing protein [Heterostelium album PN500]|eukprot:XP_020430898.1 EGF-like domain-containing protein [Heterostelium album PN500]